MWFYKRDVFYSAFEHPPKWRTYSADRLVPCETAAILAHSMYTIQPCHFMQIHICRVHARLVVTCHLRFWQNEWDLLRATVVTQGGGMDTESAQKVDPQEENYLHFWQNDQDLLRATVVIWGVGNGYRVSTESWPSRRKFSCWDSNPRPFDYKSGDLTTAVPTNHWSIFFSPPPPPPHPQYSLMKVNCRIPTLYLK